MRMTSLLLKGNHRGGPMERRELRGKGAVVLSTRWLYIKSCSQLMGRTRCTRNLQMGKFSNGGVITHQTTFF